MSHRLHYYCCIPHLGHIVKSINLQTSPGSEPSVSPRLSCPSTAAHPSLMSVCHHATMNGDRSVHGKEIACTAFTCNHNCPGGLARLIQRKISVEVVSNALQNGHKFTDTHAHSGEGERGSSSSSLVSAPLASSLASISGPSVS